MVSICRYFTSPILLIEFDPNKSFALQNGLDISKQVIMLILQRQPYLLHFTDSLLYLTCTICDQINALSVQSKLTLLTIHFPQLRIIWSRCVCCWLAIVFLCLYIYSIYFISVIKYIAIFTSLITFLFIIPAVVLVTPQNTFNI